MPKSCTKCCIKNCKKTPAKVEGQDPPIYFYSFPKDSVFFPWKAKRRLLWINAVRKCLKYDKDWKPALSTKICSAHFVGNKKSDHPMHPSYVPTIFPGVEPKQSNISFARFKRYQRSLNDQPKVQEEINEWKVTESDTCHMKINMDPETESVMALDTCVKSSSVGCQTDFNSDFDSINTNIDSFCFIEKENNICTAQVQITTNMKLVRHAATTANIVSKNNSKEIGCDPINPMLLEGQCQGFHGISSIKNDMQLSSLAGLTFPAFNYILSLLPDTKSDKLGKKNKLLLFLMKLKLGIGSTALAVLFNIHRTTAHRIFIELLETYKIILKNYIHWPPKKKIEVALPEAFKIHYPNTRVIIDCTEVKTQMLAVVTFLVESTYGCNSLAM